MGWANEMGGLTQEIVAGHTARSNERKGRQASVARFLSETETTRKGEFEKLRGQIVAQRQKRNHQVAGMRQDAAVQLGRFQQEEALAQSHWLGLGKTLARRRPDSGQQVSEPKTSRKRVASN